MSCRQVLRTAFYRYNGHEVDTQGDAIFAVFTRASDALLAAVDAQRALATQAWPDAVVVRVRMGMHTGEPSRMDEGYVGLDLHYAARIMSAANGGQVLLSQTTRDLVIRDLPASVCLRDLGEHHLKDFERPVQLYQVDIAELPINYVSLKTIEGRSSSLPIQLTSFIARDREVAAIVQRLRHGDVRLLTLTGAGGTGKTRLSIQVATELRSHFVGGGLFLSHSLLSTMLHWSCQLLLKRLAFGRVSNNHLCAWLRCCSRNRYC